MANGWDPAHTWNNRFGNNKKFKCYFKFFIIQEVFFHKFATNTNVWITGIFIC